METFPLDQHALSQKLEAAGLRPTRQRLAVYSHLAQSPHHPTVEDVYRSVRTSMPRISLATVYKALEALVRVGVANRLTADNGTTRSRYDARRDPHYHFRCLRTGTVYDLPTHFDSDLIGKIDPGLAEFLQRQGLQVTGYRLELVGYRDLAGASGEMTQPSLGSAGSAAESPPKP